MILLLDTSTAECRVWLYQNDTFVITDVWLADRSLAENIFVYLESIFSKIDKSWSDISGIGVFRGPGSFTGLRIAMAVLNSYAADNDLPIIGATGKEWRAECLKRLEAGENDAVVLPEYGREARITTPRK